MKQSSVYQYITSSCRVLSPSQNPSSYRIEAKTKCQTFYRQHFEKHFLECECMNFDCNFTESLMHLCNQSLTEGLFPTELKLANVIPLYKSDDSFLFNNH